jgi:hypothetical protein
MNTKEGLRVPGRCPLGMIVVGLCALAGTVNVLRQVTGSSGIPPAISTLAKVQARFGTLPSKVVVHVVPTPQGPPE